MKREREQRWALSRAALDPLQTEDRPNEDFEQKWRAQYRRRLLTICAVLAVWTAAIEARLTYLQVIRHDAYLSQAKRQQSDEEVLSAKRAEILDRNGEVFAYSVDADVVVANPRQVSDVDGTVQSLCQVFGNCTANDVAELTAALKKPKAFTYLRHGVSPATAAAVRELELPGVRIDTEARRYYPKRELAAQVVGFVNRDNQGLGGVELTFNKDISGKAGKAIRLSDGRQRSVDQLVLVEPTAGATLELTIDQAIQHIVERELKAGVEAQNAVSGTAVVMDPMTGEVLALASYPTFNPNAAGLVPAEQRRNRAIEDTYEPGSTFKIVTAAAAIEEGLLTTTDMIDTSPGRITVSKGRVVSDTHPHGLISFEDVIVLSSNVGAIKAGWKIGAERLNRYVHRFGFGEILSKDFKGATRGIVWKPEKLDAGALASVSMGYQIGVTPLQMVTAASAVANGGTLFQPHIVRAIIRNGRREAVEPVPVRTAVSPSTAATLTAIMEDVVERGTGTAAKIDGYQVAGKTGTAQKNVDGHYVDGAYTGSFVGFVPSRRPALAILVAIDHPRKGVYYGGTVAAPVFQKIASAALRQMAVPRTINPIAPVVISTDATLVARAAATEPEVQPAALTVDGQPVMPSVTGLSMREAMRILSKAGLQVQAKGDGVVVTQSPEPGIPISLGDTSVIQLERAKAAPAPASGGGS